ncbi:MAG: nucleotide exchange factor GrpE [Bacteroidales bacterium]|nr:nucleotide exchange factor GrpE [Bacteroidales bacterium]
MDKEEKNIKDQELNQEEKTQQDNNTETKNNTEQENNEEQTTITEDSKQEPKEETTESLGNKLLEINDKYLRLYSEFENYRKRTNKERLEMIENASESLIKDILPIVDDFERALQTMEKEEDEKVKNTKEGMTLIYKKLLSTLERKGLKPINAKGEVFDENLHEAVSQLPAQNEEDKGKVFDEVQKGYYLNNKVIRYSKVVVSI